MENTIIIKDDGLAINSAEYENYALVVTDFGGTITDTTLDGQEMVREMSPMILFRAIKEGGNDPVEEVVISTFLSLQSAFDALEEFIEHIKSGIELFDVREHNPDYEPPE